MVMEERTDQQWIRELKRGDEAAVQALWEMVFRFAVQATRKYRQNQDMGRDGAVAAYHRIRERGVFQYKFACPFPGYCRQIVVREVLRRIPKDDPYVVDIGTVYSTAVAYRDPVPRADAETVQERLAACLAGLNGREREIIEHLYYEEQTPEETAEALKLSRNNTNVIAYRARRKLLACLEGKGFESAEDVLRL